jgi:hypothetical protein
MSQTCTKERYEELNESCALGWLSFNGHRELSKLRGHFDFAPSEFELAASAICLASLTAKTPMPDRLKKQILKRFNS